MNLWVKQTGLILGLALFIFACEEPGEINLGLNPEQENFVISSVEIPVGVAVAIPESYLIRDSIFGTGRMLIGKKTDDKFGAATVEAYGAPRILGDTAVLSDGAMLDSIRLTLQLDRFYGYRRGVTGPQKIRVYELTEDIETETGSGRKYNYSGDLLAEIEFELDSLVASKNVSIDFPMDLGQKIFDKALEDTLFSRDLPEVFKGLAFVPDVSNDMLFNINPFAATSLLFNYHTGSKADTLWMVFNRSQSYFVQNDFSGTELETLVPGTEPDESTEFAYLSSVSGIYTTLDFSEILSLRDSVGKMVLNKVVISFGEIDLDTILTPPPAINVFRKTNSPDAEQFPFFQRDLLQTDSVSFERFGRSYVFDIERSTNTTTKKIIYPFPGLEQYIQNVLGNFSSVTSDDLKFLLIPDGYGRGFSQLAFDKDNVKMKLYFSHLKDPVQTND